MKENVCFTECSYITINVIPRNITWECHSYSCGIVSRIGILVKIFEWWNDLTQFLVSYDESNDLELCNTWMKSMNIVNGEIIYLFIYSHKFSLIKLKSYH